MRWRSLYLHEIYIVVDRKPVSTMRRDPTVWILLPVERHVQNPHIFIFSSSSLFFFLLSLSSPFLKVCTNLNWGRKENHRARSVTLCGHFHASLCLVVSWHYILCSSSGAFKLKILRGSGRGLFRLPRLVQYVALRTCASVALVWLHLAASARLSTREVYNNTVYAVVCNGTSGVC